MWERWTYNTGISNVVRRGHGKGNTEAADVHREVAVFAVR